MIVNALTTGVVGLVATGLAAGTSLAAHHHHDTSATSAPVVPCGAVFDRLPSALQDDLSALRTMTPTQRYAALRAIRTQALSGTYGTKVETFAEHRSQLVHRVERRLPQAMQDDIAAALKLPVDQRPAAFAAIKDRALSGGYGQRVQTGAQRLQTRIQDRVAQCAPTS